MKKEKVVGFVRVSTLKQTISMKNQVSRIKQYSKENNLDLVDIIKEEGISGGKINRKGFDQMLELVEKKEIDGIVCLNLSRIGRRTQQYRKNRGWVRHVTQVPKVLFR